MFRWTGGIIAICVCGTAVAAQVNTRAVDPVFVRAQQLVSDGNGAAGRAVVDSVLKANSPTSQIYPQALFWRASLAASAADAESDYKHIVVDYPLAPQAADALLRLAQLELARGDRDAALGHLQKIPRDYPRSKSLARAHYWIARVLFEKNDLANACAANASAQAQAGADEVELLNQIQYQGQRCASYNANRVAASVENATAAAVPPVSTTPVASSSTVATSSTLTSSTTEPATASSTPASNRSTTAVRSDSSEKIAKDTIASSSATEVSLPKQTTRLKVPIQVADTKPSKVETRPVIQTETAAEKKDANAGSRAVTPTKSVEYSVQVAAYTKRSDAETLASTLVKRGYEARVDGSVAPFRVRVGRYASEREAEAALARIKARHMEGFVVRAPAR